MLFNTLTGVAVGNRITMMKYFSNLTRGKVVLWCYLIWYLVTVYFHFDPLLSIWINSIGISAIIGMALMLSVRQSVDGGFDRWQTFRLFLMPFCVSSFSSLIKNQGFILVLPPHLFELLVSIGSCVLFVLIVTALKILNNIGVKKQEFRQ